GDIPTVSRVWFRWTSRSLDPTGDNGRHWWWRSPWPTEPPECTCSSETVYCYRKAFAIDGVRALVGQQNGQRRGTPTRFHDSLIAKSVSGTICGIIALRRQHPIRAHPRARSLRLTGSSHLNSSVTLRLSAGIMTEMVPYPDQ